MPQTICDHCGLPVPAGMVNTDAEIQFCCNGCKLVYETIHSCGLDQYYKIKENIDTKEPGVTTDRYYEPFNDDAFQDQYVSKTDEGICHIDLYLEGVHCAACVWLIEKLPAIIPGIIEVRLDMRKQVAHIVWVDDAVQLSRIARSLDSLGYPVHPYRVSQMEEIKKKEYRQHLIRIAIAGACMSNVMVIAFALYGGMFSGMDMSYRSYFRWVSLAITLIAVLGPGKTFFVGALSSFRTRMMHMDLPVAIALTAGTVWGGYNTITNQGEIYFESITAIVFLLLVGRWIQHHQQQAAHEAVELLFTLTPSTARLIVDENETKEIPIEALKPEDHIIIRAHDAIPADGIIIEGHSTVDLSLLTGESKPIPIKPGDMVHAGTINLTTQVTMKALTTGAETRVGRLMNMVEQFAQNKPPLVMLANRIAHFFVIAVLMLAGFTLIFWLFISPESPTAAIEHTMAMLIVTCPCALGLATPLALIVAIGQATKQGILIKGGEPIEQLNTPGIILLDKTGTITRGQLRLVKWMGDETLKPIIVAIEKNIAHPVAAAFLKAFQTQDANSDTLDHQYNTNVTHIPGQGIRATVDNESILIGSEAWITSQVTNQIPEWILEQIKIYTNDALSPVLIAVDDTITGIAGFGDPILDDAPDAIDKLRKMGWAVGIISGDHDAVVKAVARQVGIDEPDCKSRVNPEQKAEIVIQEMKKYQTVVMVGDGVNDAAALSAASVGIAVHGGAEVSLAAADIFLNRSGLTPIVELLQGSKRSVQVIKRNFAISLLYNVIAASFTVAGLVNPLIAAILMPLSSISVVTLSYRSRIFTKS